MERSFDLEHRGLDDGLRQLGVLKNESVSARLADTLDFGGASHSWIHPVDCTGARKHFVKDAQLASPVIQSSLCRSNDLSIHEFMDIDGLDRDLPIFR